MKTIIIMAMMPMLLASAAYAAGGSHGSHFGDVDIIGSDLNNIKIFSSDSGLDNMEKNLDIIGSKLENIKIFSDEINPDDTEIVGSTIKNVEIKPAPEKKEKPKCDKFEHDDASLCYWDPACIDLSHKEPHFTCPKAHFGVDAWYGKYWFNDQMYTPKWPQIY